MHTFVRVCVCVCVCVLYRYELPGIRALNFVVGDSLGGGGVASLRIDPQVSIYSTTLTALMQYIRPQKCKPIL